MEWVLEQFNSLGEQGLRVINVESYLEPGQMMDGNGNPLNRFCLNVTAEEAILVEREPALV
jgi:hypothetical protein